MNLIDVAAAMLIIVLLVNYWNLFSHILFWGLMAVGWGLLAASIYYKDWTVFWIAEGVFLVGCIIRWTSPWYKRAKGQHNTYPDQTESLEELS